MNAIYNEIEPFACDWLERLVDAGHITAGRVERRSIADLTPADVHGPGQRHFFAGIGVWSYALRLAGVDDTASIWTGSCPCQPFSGAGSRLGVLDPRHLWPTWFELIRECRPAIVFGEQVASRDGLAWLDLVRADLERCGYAFGASDLCAAGVGAPHIRQRIYFVAYADGGKRIGREWLHLRQGRSQQAADDTRGRGQIGVGNTGVDGDQQHDGKLQGDEGEREVGAADRYHAPIFTGADRHPWRDIVWIPCSEPSGGIVYRPAEPGTFPLAHGVAGRVGRLRAYGNAIVSEVAATFIEAAMMAIQEQKT